MRVCLLGEYSGNLDEGMRNVSFHFAKELKKRHKILILDLRDVLSKAFWKGLKNFNPEIIHYIHGPSIKSFILLKVLSFYCREAKTVMSAMHPGFSFLSKRILPIFKPDLTLVQSYETEETLKKLKCKTEFLPCGVDVERFTPVTKEAKDDLRVEYGIENEKFVILHVGSIKKGRSIQLLEKLQKWNNQVVIVGAVSPGIEKNLISQLKESRCLVWTKYFENIEEIYALSDCYLFPTTPMNRLNAIEMPLSVLEAMSCNLPLISTKFGALTRVFKEGNGLIFVDKEEDFIITLENVKSDVIDVKTREMVLPYSWGNITKKLEKIYVKVANGDVL